MNFIKCASPLVVVATITCSATAAPVNTPEPIILEVVVPLSLDDAWDQWTTVEGLQGFLSREAFVEPHVLGEYSIHFFPNNPPGDRGAEGMVILAFEPNDRLSFTWNAPPNLPLARAQMAVVEITFDAISDHETAVTFRHDHFGRNADAGLAREYFNLAWQTILLRSAYAAEHGPIDWDNPPDSLMFRAPSREELDALVAN